MRGIVCYANGVRPYKTSLIAVPADDTLQQPTPHVRHAHEAGLVVHAYTFRPENNFLPASPKDGGTPATRNTAGSIREIQAYLRAGATASSPTIRPRAARPSIRSSAERTERRMRCAAERAATGRGACRAAHRLPRRGQITWKWCVPSRFSWSTSPYSQSRYACIAAAALSVPSYGRR